MIVISRRAQRHADRAGNPRDDLLNMFDLEIVLAVAFLIAGFSLSQLLKNRASTKANVTPTAGAIAKSQKLLPLKPGQRRVPVANGARTLGVVYEEPDGQLVYVTGVSKRGAIPPIPSTRARPSSVYS
jgi:hypothetical protein